MMIKTMPFSRYGGSRTSVPQGILDRSRGVPYAPNGEKVAQITAPIRCGQKYRPFPTFRTPVAAPKMDEPEHVV